MGPDQQRIPTEEDSQTLRRWLEVRETHETPIADWLKRVPDYVGEKISVPVEPYYSDWVALERRLNDIKGCYECGGPSRKWFKKTKKLKKLEKRAETERLKAWKTVPNPNFDAEKAREWSERGKYQHTIIKTGQSYAPKVNNEPIANAKAYAELFLGIDPGSYDHFSDPSGEQ